MFEPVKQAIVKRKVSGETRPAESGGRAWPKRPCQMVRHETIGWVAEAGEIENTALPSACPNNGGRQPTGACLG